MYEDDLFSDMATCPACENIYCLCCGCDCLVDWDDEDEDDEGE